jgi:DNA-binding transcriptional LysR family regulator
MSARPTRPQLEAPDLSPSTRRPGDVPFKTAPSDPRFEAVEQLETHAALLQGVKAGRVRVVNPDTVPPRPELPAPAQPARRRSPETSLSTKVPEYVMQQLRRRYADTGVTIRNQLLLALKKEGLAIEEVDIQDERKRVR